MVELTRDEFMKKLINKGYVHTGTTEVGDDILRYQIDKEGYYAFSVLILNKPFATGVKLMHFLQFYMPLLRDKEIPSIALRNQGITAYDIEELKKAERMSIKEAKKKFIPELIAKIKSKELEALLKE